MRTKVAVVILNWNGIALLKEFLPSVVNTIPQYAKVFVLDNASTDESVNYIHENFPSVQVLHNDDNYGFAEGYNKGLPMVDAEYLVLLNSDVECAKNWIEPVIDFMDEHKKVAVCQPKIMDYKNKESFEYAGAAGGYIDTFGFPFCRGRIFNELEKDSGQYNNPTSIFWATGACLFVRKTVFESVDGFDSSFFAHMEEIDMCWRILRAGHEIYYIPSSTVYHLGGGTLKKLNPQKTYLNFRNNLMMILKNNQRNGFIFTLFFKLILDGIAGLKFLLEGSPKHTWSVLKAHLFLYRNLRKVLKKRKALRIKYPKTAITPFYSGSIVLDHYLLGKKTFSELKFNPKNLR